MYNCTIQDITGTKIHAWIHPTYKVEQILRVVNGCCPGRPVIITSNIAPGGHINYSAQCACGGWCTTGKATAKEAAEEWYKMCGQNPRGWIRSAVTGRKVLNDGRLH